MHSHEVHWLQKVFAQVITKGHRQITVLQSLPIPSQVLILILGTMMIPFILALTFSIFLTSVFAILGIIMCIRWIAMFNTEESEILGDGNMKVPTFYASESARMSEATAGESIAFFF